MLGGEQLLECVPHLITVKLEATAPHPRLPPERYRVMTAG